MLVQSCPERKIFGDLITADHKVLSEGCESRRNHRYAVVVQDLATRWLQSYPFKSKTSSQETQKKQQKFLEPTRKPKVIYTDNRNLANVVRIFPGLILRQHRTDRKQMGYSRKSSAQSERRDPSAVLLQSGLDKAWWADCMECCCYLRNIQDLLSDGKTPYERPFGIPF